MLRWVGAAGGGSSGGDDVCAQRCSDAVLRMASPGTRCLLPRRRTAGRMGDCQLWSGPGGSEARPTPLVVGGGLQFVELVAGSDHVCGVLFNGSAACWGGCGLGRWCVGRHVWRAWGPC